MLGRKLVRVLRWAQTVRRVVRLLLTPEEVAAVAGTGVSVFRSQQRTARRLALP